MPTQYYRGDIATPLGRMIAVVDADGALLRLDFDDDNRQRRSDDLAEQAIPDAAVIAPVAAQLGEYFAGQRRVFELALAPIGNTFLQTAWARLIQVPYGSLATYGELASQLGTSPAPMAAPMPSTRSRSSSPATASSAPAANSPAIAAVSPARRRYWRWSRGLSPGFSPPRP